MGSTLRNDTHKPIFLSRLMDSWEKVPKLTFTQLIATVVVDTPPLRLTAMTDDEFAEAIERALLLSEPPTR